jgi:hypothetical protein
MNMIIHEDGVAFLDELSSRRVCTGGHSNGWKAFKMGAFSRPIEPLQIAMGLSADDVLNT